MKSANKLMAGSACLLWATTGMLYYYIIKISEKILNTSSCKEALELLKHHEGAISLLGEPIKEKHASYIDHPTLFRIIVEGSKSKGKLLVTVAPDENQKMRIDNIQLQIGRDDSKRLIIKDSVKVEE